MLADLHLRVNTGVIFTMKASRQPRYYFSSGHLVCPSAEIIYIKYFFIPAIYETTTL
jgi:hypothetical protein